MLITASNLLLYMQYIVLSPVKQVIMVSQSKITVICYLNFLRTDLFD